MRTGIETWGYLQNVLKLLKQRLPSPMEHYVFLTAKDFHLTPEALVEEIVKEYTCGTNSGSAHFVRI